MIFESRKTVSYERVISMVQKKKKNVFSQILVGTLYLPFDTIYKIESTKNV